MEGVPGSGYSEDIYSPAVPSVKIARRIDVLAPFILTITQVNFNFLLPELVLARNRPGT